MDSTTDNDFNILSMTTGVPGGGTTASLNEQFQDSAAVAEENPYCMFDDIVKMTDESN